MCSFIIKNVEIFKTFGCNTRCSKFNFVVLIVTKNCKIKLTNYCRNKTVLNKQSK